MEIVNLSPNKFVYDTQSKASILKTRGFRFAMTVFTVEQKIEII